MTHLSDRLDRAASLAKREVEASLENSREHQIGMAVHGIGHAIDTLRWAWVDPKNHQHIAAERDYLIEQRDHFSRLIENVEAYQLAHQVAAE